jgi:hypothetical protein
MEGALDSILQLERTLAPGSSGGGGGVMAPAAPVQCKDTAAVQASVGQATDERQKQARIIANAFACDVTRVVVWKLLGSADASTPYGGFHNTAHSMDNNPDANAKCTTIYNWLAQQVSYLVSELKRVRDPLGTGSVFENTVVFWTNECREGNHNPRNLPLVILGTGGGKIETNRVLKVGADDAFNYGNVLVALANAAGDPMKTFGDTRWCKGPLAGLLKPGVAAG